MVQTGFDAVLLDVVKRDDDFLLAYAGEPVRTPGGREVAHYDVRLLEHVAREGVLRNDLSVERLASLALYVLEADVLAQGRDPVVEAFEALINDDPLLVRRFGCGRADLRHRRRRRRARAIESSFGATGSGSPVPMRSASSARTRDSRLTAGTSSATAARQSGHSARCAL